MYISRILLVRWQLISKRRKIANSFCSSCTGLIPINEIHKSFPIIIEIDADNSVDWSDVVCRLLFHVNKKIYSLIMQPSTHSMGSFNQWIWCARYQSGEYNVSKIDYNVQIYLPLNQTTMGSKSLCICILFSLAIYCVLMHLLNLLLLFCFTIVCMRWGAVCAWDKYIVDLM